MRLQTRTINRFRHYMASNGEGGVIRRVDKRHYIIIAIMLTVLFVVENTQLLGIDGYFNYYLLFALKIVLWIMLGIVIKFFPGSMFSGLVRLKGMVTNLAFLFSAFYIICFVIIGMLTSFGKNIYSITPKGIALNLVPMAAGLIGGEMCRSFLINSLSGKRPHRAILGFGILFAIFNMSLSKMGGFSDSLDFLKFITDTVFPQLILSIVASCLVYLSGPIPSIVYLGIIVAFGYLSPYIPNPDLILKMLFTVFVPLISIFAIMKIYSKEALDKDRTNRKNTITAGWVATCVLSIAIVWFFLGVFPIYPSVILTGSMEPTIMPGDIILVEKIGIDSVNVGDVIMFNNGEGMFITHRVIEKSDNTGEILCATKGDNNSNADAGAVNSSQLKGRVITIIPDIGKLTLYLRGSIGA